VQFATHGSHGRATTSGHIVSQQRGPPCTSDVPAPGSQRRAPRQRQPGAAPLARCLARRRAAADAHLACADAHQVDRLVDAAEGRDVHGLPAHDAARADARRVLARARVDERAHVHLQRVLVRQQVDDLERLLHDAQRQQLLAVVASLAHQRVAQPLHDRALRLAKALDLVAPCRMRHEDLQP